MKKILGTALGFVLLCVIMLFSAGCATEANLGISSETLTVEGDTLSAVLPNSVSMFLFIENITVSDGAKLTVSTDSEFQSSIPGAMAELTEGDNIFYIKVTKGSKSKTYTANIRRKPMYTVSFDTQGGTPIADQILEEGMALTVPDEPVKLGCTFKNWDTDLTQPVTSNLTVKAEFTVNEEMKPFEFTSTDTECIITGTVSQMPSHLVIPDTVTAIGEQAFYNNNSLITVTGGNNVTYIGEEAFIACFCLKTVILGDKIEKIDTGAFTRCSELNTVYLGESLSSIEKNAFSECYKLFEVINRSALDIRAGSTGFGGVGAYALEVHSGEESKVVNLNDYLFYTCENENYLVGYVGKEKALILPDSYKNGSYKICKYAFYEKTYNVQSVIIPNCVTEIGDSAFEGCSGLESLTLGQGVTSIGKNAFNDCRELTELVLPDSVTVIDDKAFYGCSRISRVIIGNGVQSIGNEAFYMCTALTEVTIGENVSKIGRNAFGDCYNLEKAVFQNTEKWYYSTSPNGQSIAQIPSSNISDHEKAAKILRESYCNYYLRRV